MKKVILLFLVLTLGGKWALAQDENNIKNFRFGLKATGMLTWYKPEDKKKYESNGVTARGSYGLITEFRLNKVASIATGVQVDYDGGKLLYKTDVDTNFYFLSKDGELLSRGDSVAGADKYRLDSRFYRTTYLTIPLSLKLKTPEIGSLTYYGQFGVNASFRLKSRVDDDVNAVLGGTFNQNIGGKASQSDLLNTSDMNIFKFSLNVGGGAEWNLAGSTSLVFGLNWYNGFSNVLKSDSKYVFRTQNNGYAETKQNAKASAIALTFGVLF